MKIYFSPASPYVRKCLVVAHELGLAEQIEKLPSNAHPVNRDRVIIADNPLGQVPTFFTDEGSVLYDSRVICEYLDARANGSMFPAQGARRWSVLTQQALADGMLGACLIARYEDVARPEALRWTDWRAAQLDKVTTGLAWMEAHIDELQSIDIGTISLACLLGYLDFRFPDLPWRGQAPRTAQWFAAMSERPSFKATFPHV
ncbi:MAG: glutathione S-transferase [Burkholderiaceae bacterium]|nr:MAG: glutathione S-transferase [Burkholderiaceae bacterium]